MDERINKLPKWAQHELRRLESENDRLRKDMAARNNPDAAIQVYPSLLDRELSSGFPGASVVRFALGSRGWIDMHLHDDEVLIYGSGRVSLNPEATNHLSIRVR